MPDMNSVTFELPCGEKVFVEVSQVLNAGYAGRDQKAVQEHIDELAELGVPAPSNTPTLYPVSDYLAQQTEQIRVQHSKTSGEAEWALILSEVGPLLSVACDHTDRDLEVHGVAWSKNASPDVLGKRAWKLADVREHLDQLSLKAWVGKNDVEHLIQDSTLGDLLSPDYWLEVLSQRGLDKPGTVLVSGTVPMIAGVDQFAQSWRVELRDPVTGEVMELKYQVEQLPKPIS